MAASRAVLTSFEWSARSRSAWLWCWSVDCRGTIFTATCSPVALCFASLTLPMLPAPMVFPSAHVPVLGALMVVLRLVPWAVEPLVPDLVLSVATPLMGIAEAVDASDA